MALRPATNDDYHAFHGMQAPLHWSGLVEATDYFIRGIGGIYLARDDRWWMFFKRAPGVRMTKTAHKAATILINSVFDTGMTVRAIPDLDIQGAEVWLRRLGFEKTTEIIEGHTVWKLG